MEKSQKEGVTFGEYPQTQSVGIKSTINQSDQAKPNLTASTGYNSMEGEYISPNNSKIEAKNSKEGVTFSEYPQTQSVGIKSTINQSIQAQPDLTASTGYNSMEGEYSSTTKSIEAKNSKEGATFGEYPQTQSVGIKSTVNKSIEKQNKLTSSTGYNSMDGAYSSSTITSNQIETKNSKEGSTFAEYPPSNTNTFQPQIRPLIIQVPPNAPIINNNLPLVNIEKTVTVTTTTTSINNSNPGFPNNIQNIPITQPLAGSTFAEYPQTLSNNGIKSASINQSNNQ